MSDELRDQIDYLVGRQMAVEGYIRLMLGTLIRIGAADNRQADVDDQMLATQVDQLKAEEASAETLRGFEEAWMDVRDTTRRALRERNG